MICSSGALEAVLCLKAIEHRTIPATIHLDRPDPECDLDYVANQHLHDRDIHNALNLSFGFGGANAGVMIARAE